MPPPEPTPADAGPMPAELRRRLASRRRARRAGQTVAAVAVIAAAVGAVVLVPSPATIPQIAPEPALAESPLLDFDSPIFAGLDRVPPPDDSPQPEPERIGSHRLPGWKASI